MKGNGGVATREVVKGWRVAPFIRFSVIVKVGQRLSASFLDWIDLSGHSRSRAGWECRVRASSEA